jgi:hypothetical protein
VINLDQLRELAADVRIFIEASEDKNFALMSVVAAYDVVLGIFPSAAGMEFHVIKGNEILNQIVQSQTAEDYTHTAIALQSREQAVTLQLALAA